MPEVIACGYWRWVATNARGTVTSPTVIDCGLPGYVRVRSRYWVPEVPPVLCVVSCTKPVRSPEPTRLVTKYRPALVRVVKLPGAALYALTVSGGATVLTAPNESRPTTVLHWPGVVAPSGSPSVMAREPAWPTSSKYWLRYLFWLALVVSVGRTTRVTLLHAVS